MPGIRTVNSGLEFIRIESVKSVVKDSGLRDLRAQRGKNQTYAQRTTRAPPPAICFSTSLRVAIEVSPGVVEARAPWAAP